MQLTIEQAQYTSQMMIYNSQLMAHNARVDQLLNDSRLEVERLKSGVNFKLTHINRFTFLLLYVPLNHLIGDIS